MGLAEELELVELLRGNGLSCAHRLKQAEITGFIRESGAGGEWLEKNAALPRGQHTYEVDVLAWGHGAFALAIEHKAQYGSAKTLCLPELTMHNGSVELQRAAGDLFLQCCGSGYLGQAYCDATGLNKRVIPVGVVDYDIDIGGAKANWAFHRGVFFVRTGHFAEFLSEFLKDPGWIAQLSNSCA